MDDKSTLMTCVENREFTNAAKISSGEQSNAGVFVMMDLHETAWQRFDWSTLLSVEDIY